MSIDPHLEPGTRTILGSYVFEPEAIMEFAAKFDPQPFHTDPEAARQSVFGGLCASGWHTTAVWMKLHIADEARWTAERVAKGLPAIEFGPSPGIRNLRWLRPVFAGSTITFAHIIRELRRYAGRPGWSILETSAEAWNEKDEMVLTFDSAVLVNIATEE